MDRRLLSINVLILFLLLVMCFRTDAQKKSVYKEYPIINITGDEPANPDSKKFTGDLNAVMNLKPYTTTHSDSIITITDVFTGVTSLYDISSNGVAQHICQWYNDTIHVIIASNMTPGLPTSARRVLYLVSTNCGLNWSSPVQVPEGIPSGYASLNLFDDGRAVISENANVNGMLSHAVILQDQFPIGRIFHMCDPYYMPDSNLSLWTRLVTTSSNKICFIASINNTNVNPYTYSNILTNSTRCMFSGWNPLSDVAFAEMYAIDRASNGTIGLAYIRRGDLITSNAGDVRFMQSTDGGLTWSAPITIYDAQPASPYFLGGLRGIDLVYTGTTPNVTFDLGWQSTANYYFPNLCGKVMFWSPGVNGGNPVVIADSTNTAWHPIHPTGDAFTPICRGSVGRSRDNQVLYCTYNVARNEIGIDSAPYFDCYLAWSLNHGATWEGRQRLTNYSGPLRDCRFPNIAPVNDCGSSYFANIEYLNDSIPGMAIYGSPESPAQQHFLRAQVLISGVSSNQNNLPENYELLQNYPNPFNPVTIIKYLLPKPSYVKLAVYDALGKETAVLVNGFVRLADNEIMFDGAGLASGVYFYMLEVSDGNKKKYLQSKKMVLLK